MKIKQEWLYALIFFLLLFFVLGREAYQRHKNIPATDWQAEIRADGAGYYVYLPMWFDYGFEAENFPESADEKTGGGFSLQDTSGIVRTKYFCGTALLMSPFYLTWKTFSNDHPFSASFNRMVSWSAAFIMSLAALLLFYVCRAGSGNYASLFAVFTAIFGTTAYYYTVQNPMWSHAWSFFTVSLLLFLNRLTWVKYNGIRIVLLGLFSSLLIVIRPTNALLLIPIFYFHKPDRKELNTKNIGLFVIAFILPFLPQIHYWQILSGSYWYDAYTGEGFHHLTQPEICRLLFDSMCGLMPWTPVFVVYTALLFSALSGNKTYRYTLLFVYIIFIYLFSSWSTVNFGTCGFGARAFTETVPLFTPLLATFMRRSYFGINSKWWIACGLAVSLSLSITIRLSKNFAHCYEQSRPYDFRGYLRQLKPVLSTHSNYSMVNKGIELKISRAEYFRQIEAEIEIKGLAQGEKLSLEMRNNLRPEQSQEGEFSEGLHRINLHVNHYSENPNVILRLSSKNHSVNLSQCSIKAIVY